MKKARDRRRRPIRRADLPAVARSEGWFNSPRWGKSGPRLPEAPAQQRLNRNALPSSGFPKGQAEGKGVRRDYLTSRIARLTLASILSNPLVVGRNRWRREGRPSSEGRAGLEGGWPRVASGGWGGPATGEGDGGRTRRATFRKAPGGRSHEPLTAAALNTTRTITVIEVIKNDIRARTSGNDPSSATAAGKARLSVDGASELRLRFERKGGAAVRLQRLVSSVHRSSPENER
jgi:hypothetical protein